MFMMQKQTACQNIVYLFRTESAKLLRGKNSPKEKIILLNKNAETSCFNQKPANLIKPLQRKAKRFLRPGVCQNKSKKQNQFICSVKKKAYVINFPFHRKPHRHTQTHNCRNKHDAQLQAGLNVHHANTQLSVRYWISRC